MLQVIIALALLFSLVRVDLAAQARVRAVATGGGNVVAAASCSQAHVAAAIVTAVDGDTVTIPACANGSAATWTSGVAITEALTITGSGGGKVEGSSVTSRTIGTGSHSFTLRDGSALVGWTAGQTVRARVKYAPTYMEGTVTSWDAATDVLVLNITSTSGAGGTHEMWTFQTPGTTQIIHSGTGALFTLTESTAGSIKFSGVQFLRGSGSTAASFHIQTYGTTGGQPIFIRDSMFEGYSSAYTVAIGVNRGVLYRNYFHGTFNWDAMSNNIDTAHGVMVSLPIGSDSWNTASTMGTADTTGLNNFYIEDNYFVGLTTEASDVQDHGRSVWRRNVFDNSGMSSHGPDTGPIGMRHTEIYDNLMIFHNTSGNDGDGDSRTPGMNYWFLVRGGTYVWTGNTADDITSSDWSDKPDISMLVMPIERNAGPYFCYDDNNNHASQNFGRNGYPMPRQVGQGRVTGAASNEPFTPFAYQGDIEAAHVWGNTTSHTLIFSVGADGGNTDCVATFGARPAASTYIQSGRDYYPATAKPGWTRYTYPHPSRP